MKILLKKVIPLKIISLYRELKNSKKKSIFWGKTVEETFNYIFETNHWSSNMSFSGTGSHEVQTELIVKEISSLLESKDIKSVLDIPCGDFNWMKKVNLGEKIYIGADIVNELIKKNKINYGVEGQVEFEKINLICDPLPQSDIIINRDCLVHLSFADIHKSLQNIKSSGCKYLLTTTFPDHTFNDDIVTGDWRTLNLENKPFKFPSPIVLINENCTEGNGRYSDKSLGLWRIDDIYLPEKIYK